MKKKWLCTVLLLMFVFAFTSFAATPVVNVENLTREKDGTVTVELNVSSEYDIVELRVAKGSHGKDGFNSASPVSGTTISGLKSGSYTLFAKDANGNIGAYPMNVSEASKSSSQESSTEESVEQEWSTSYGSAWISQAYETSECVPETVPCTTAPEETLPEETTPAPTEPEPDEPEDEPNRPTRKPKPEKDDMPKDPYIVTTEAPTEPVSVYVVPAETTAPMPTEEVQMLPQTGGLDARMLFAIAIVITGLVGMILYSRGKKQDI